MSIVGRLLLFVTFLSLALQGFAITGEDLKIRLHSKLAEIKIGVYGSVVTFKEGTVLSNENIVHLAYTAHEAMRGRLAGDKAAAGPGSQSFRNDVTRNYGPTVMTAVVQDNHVFLASSMKGRGLIYDPKTTKIDLQLTSQSVAYWKGLKSNVCPSAVQQGLQDCGFLVTDTKGAQHAVGHQNGGSCGEVFAGWALCDTVPKKNSPVRVVTVAYSGEKMVIKEPCGATPEEDVLGWIPRGCQTFTRSLGWTVIPSGTKAIDAGHVSVESAREATYHTTSHARAQAQAQAHGH